MPILEVETDKIANAVAAPDPGLLRRRLAAPGEVLPVKALLGVMAPPEVSDGEIDAYVAAYVVPAAGEGDEAQAGPAYQWAGVDGIRVRYARRGDDSSPAVPVLFLHGFGGDLDNWLFNLDAVAAAAPVIALDLPGHGQSDARLPGGATLADLAFAWHAVRAVKSNAILLARDGASVGIGMGQVNRVDSCRLAVDRAGAQRAHGAVAASDAFFPFADGLVLLVEAGVRAVVQPGGSVRDPEVIAAAQAAGVTMYLTGTRHFAH